MENKRKFPFLEEEKWDAEKALEQRRDLYSAVEKRVSQSKSEETKRPTQKAHTANRKKTKKKKSNIKGRLILAAIAAVILAIIIGIICLIVALVAPDDDSQTDAPTGNQETAEITPTKEETKAALVERADRLAASYDYDAAIAVLQEYGEDWQEQVELVQAYAQYVQLQTQLVRWEDTTTIPHVFFRALIVDTERAFDGDQDEVTYQQSMITVDEFRAILNELYANNFVLINMHDMLKNVADGEGETEFVQGDIYLPEGKKPIVLSQEDVNYYQYRVDGPDEDTLPDAQGDGFACQLLLDENGELTCKYIDADGNILYGAYDFVPILEEFVEEHPDFSYRGAKGMLAVTGMEGVFGFQTHPDWEDVLGKDAYIAQIREAQAVTAALKERGWEIASQSYSKISFSDNSAQSIRSNLEKWENEVAPVVGKTDILVYPYGSDIGSVQKYSGEKFNVLYDAGYRIFCNIDATEYWVQLKSNYMRQARRAVDGYRLENGASLLDDLFDVNKVKGAFRPVLTP